MRKAIARLLRVAAVVAVIALLAAAGFWVAISFQRFPELEPYRATYGLDALYQAAASRPPGPEGFSFVVLGDTRSNIYIGEHVFGEAAKEPMSLMFDTGDLIHHGTAEEYLEMHIPLLEKVAPTPVFCVPGNHDRGKYRNFAAYNALYGGERFSFDYGDCRFVGFNANETVRVSRSDLRYLERELSKPGAKYKFVFFHIPPAYFEKEVVISGSRGFEWNAERLREILVEQKVDEVFMGHIHGYASEVIDGVRYTITAGAGAPLAEQFARENRLYHYVVVHVRPDGLSREVVYMRDGEWERKDVAP